MILIKAIHTKTFSVELIEMEGEYVVFTEDQRDSTYTDPIKDLKTAFVVFDNKVKQLEGQ